MVFNTKLRAEPRASFTVDRLEKVLDIVRQVTNDLLVTEWPLSFFQSGFGNLTWLQKVYHSFKDFTAAYRRPMAKVPTAHALPGLMISPKHATESVAEGARKFRKDNKTLEILILHLIKEKLFFGESSSQFV